MRGNQKKLLLLLVIVSSSVAVFAQATTNFHDYSGRDIEGADLDFSDYYGKKVMVVNTASLCAFTHQFEDLQTLYEQYSQYDFEIIGFPCNDFDNQDPGSDSTILEFCTEEYGVTFQMMSKIIAVEPDTAPVFRWLQEEELNGVADAPITWNFHKFLIDEAGNWVAHHNSFVSPTSSDITDWIMSPSALSIADADEQAVQLFEMVATAGSEMIQLKYLSDQPEHLEVNLYSMDGRMAAQLFSGIPAVGQTLSFDASALPTGIYVVRANAGAAQQTFRYALVR